MRILKILQYFVILYLVILYIPHVHAALLGDGNADGIVDGKDFILWLNNYGKTVSGSVAVGDFNNDKIVNGKDFIVWLNQYGQTESDFVTRQGSDLYLSGKKIRFAGANIFWLQLDSRNGQLLYPSQFRIFDAIYTVKQMGGNVIRTWSNSVGCTLCIQPTKDQFNQQGFQSLDYAIKIAGDYNLKIILTLSDNYKYFHGGKSTFTSWYGVSEDQFFTNTQVINAYKRFIATVMNHVNTFTGKKYKDDPTIMAWETGNELSWNLHFAQWTQDITEYIKSIAPKQLVIDGHYGIDQDSLNISTVDIFSNHYRTKIELNNESTAVAIKNKSYMLGEYKWNGGRNDSDNLLTYLQAIESSKSNISIFWSLMGHADDKGYVSHNDGYSLYYPGYTNDELDRISLLRHHFFKFTSVPEVPHTQPLPPVLYGNILNSQVTLTWRGTPTAKRYIVERSVNKGSTWTQLSTVLTDTNPTFTDTPPERPVYYRLKGITTEGITGHNSNTVILN